MKTRLVGTVLMHNMTRGDGKARPSFLEQNSIGEGKIGHSQSLDAIAMRGKSKTNNRGRMGSVGKYGLSQSLNTLQLRVKVKTDQHNSQVRPP